LTFKNTLISKQRTAGADRVRRTAGIRWLRNLKIGAKLTLGFVTVALIAGIVGMVGALNIDRLNREADEVYQTNIKVLGPLHKISADLLKLRINTVYHVLASDKFRYEFAVKSAQSTINHDLADLKKNYNNKALTEQLTNLSGAFQAYWQEEANVLKLSNENKIDKATQRMDQKLNSLASLIDSIIDSLFTASDTDARTKTEVNHSAATQTIHLLTALAIIAIIASLGLGNMISKGIGNPLRHLTVAAEQLAAGDISLSIATINSQDEIALLNNAFAKMADSLRELAGRVQENSNILYQAGRELKNTANDTGKSAQNIATTINELAQATSDQTQHTNEAVTKIDVLAGLVRKVSVDIENISAESEGIAQSAALGQKATQDVAEEIIKIYEMTQDVTVVIAESEKTSREITSITTVIRNIAEQTTLLALNAAIEAARAGEHGRGFGVVAQETGKLAEQSKQAAQLIGDLIVKINQRSQEVVRSMTSGMNVVTEGKKLVMDATATFEEIFNKLNNVLKRINAIAVAAQEMATSNEDMVKEMNKIAVISEESMANTEEISAAAEEQSAAVEQVNTLAGNLAAISDKLQQAVAQFKTQSN
jgi:methyl-accepting chemotaxis protein